MRIQGMIFEASRFAVPKGQKEKNNSFKTLGFGEYDLLKAFYERVDAYHKDTTKYIRRRRVDTADTDEGVRCATDRRLNHLVPSEVTQCSQTESPSEGRKRSNLGSSQDTTPKGSSRRCNGSGSILFTAARGYRQGTPFSECDFAGDVCGMRILSPSVVYLAAQHVSSLIGGSTPLEVLFNQTEYEALDARFSDHSTKRELAVMTCLLKSAEISDPDSQSKSFSSFYSARHSMGKVTSTWDTMTRAIKPVTADDLLPHKHYYTPYGGDKDITLIHDVLKKALRRNPYDRYQTVREFAADLERPMSRLVSCLEGNKTNVTAEGSALSGVKKMFGFYISRKRHST